MRELRACDFCDDDAVGVYEPLPPEIADQRRIALCGACRDTLEDVLAPLEGGGEETPAVTIDDTDDEKSGPGAERPHSDPGSGTDAGTAGPDVSEAEPNENEPNEGASAGKQSNADGDAGNADEPEGFRTVMRLLNNRSFPLERAVATELASGAYDFSDSEVEGILDYAVERGVLEESGGELHRG